MTQHIYLDYNASTPVDPAVIDVMNLAARTLWKSVVAPLGGKRSKSGDNEGARANRGSAGLPKR